MSEQTQTAGLWDPYEGGQEDREKIHSESSSFAQDVWYRFTHKPTALLGLVLLVLLAIFCLAGPSFTGHSYDRQDLNFVNIPPTFTAYEVEGQYVYLTQNLKLITVSREGELLAPLTRLSEDGMKKRETFDLGDGREVVLNYKAKPARLEDGEGNIYATSVRMRNKTFALGTDNLGRDMLTRLMMGMRISLLIAFIAAAVNLVIGILYGGVSGYLGGTVDAVMMRIVDVVNTIPLTLYVILIQVVMGSSSSGILSIVIALGSVYWVNMARTVRGEILSLKEQEFVHAARTLGSSTGRILMTHLIPNAMGPIIVTVTMLIPNAIFIEAFMSFIGLGVLPPNASLGTMCNDALTTLRSSPFQLFLPALAICLIMFAFNFIGDGLRDALDPKLRK